MEIPTLHLEQMHIIIKHAKELLTQFGQLISFIRIGGILIFLRQIH